MPDLVSFVLLQSSYTVEDEHNDKPPLTQMPALTVAGGNTVLEPSVVHLEPPGIKNNKSDAEGQGGNIRLKFVLTYAEFILVSTKGHKTLYYSCYCEECSISKFPCIIRIK